MFMFDATMSKIQRLYRNVKKKNTFGEIKRNLFSSSVRLEFKTYSLVYFYKLFQSSIRIKLNLQLI